MKKNLVSVSGSALKLGFSSLPGRWRRRRVGARRPGRSAAEEGGEVSVRVCSEDPQVCATCAWGRTRGRDGGRFSSKSRRESRHIMLQVNYVKAVHSQHVTSLGGNELSAVQMRVPISLQRGDMQLRVWGTAGGLEPAVG